MKNKTVKTVASTKTNGTWNHVTLEIVNFYDEDSFFDMMMATCLMILFIGCGFWLICASCQLRKEDENSYHLNKDFKKDEDDQRLKGGKEDVRIHVEG
ncbi:hypothetical protein GCK72_016525 [Caenorhabditis remanei]|uniref:Uncharacterized protein n=1 Tax=Caenorhabditis remanei TaxID=31234 RepID=A0A6A5G4V9_CAERE|nr:hypothetical protein GCK72_016525 [Caenorhabditis remanei]KAF1749980.1 hypothetical protein GCK72_016525 [Caenorhabditis remanei]